MRRIIMIAMALFSFPAFVSAFQTTDDILWPAEGAFPAYPRETDERPVQFSVSGGLYRDNNIFRLSDGTDPLTTIGSTSRSDTVRRVGVGLKVDRPVSRQRLLVNVRIDDYDFRRFGVLDHIAYRADAAWKWQLGNQWSGDIGYARRRFLASLAEIQRPVKDLITEDRVFAGAGYLVTPRWRVRGGLDWVKWNHSDETRAELDARIASGTIGFDYVTPANNSIGGQFKYSRGDFPNRELVAGSFIDNRYEEYETSAVINWMPAAKSTLNARLGYTSRRHDQVPQRDFDGVTGRLDLVWTPAPKTLLNLAAWREIRSIEDVAASYVLSRGFSFGPDWAPTAALVFQAKYLRETREFQGDPGFVLLAGPQREDTFRGIRLAAGYNPRRNLDFALALERGDRDSNVAGRDYDFNRVSANARFRF
jgi:exopolysaccharide biosynthesis operon protein EpsL